MGPGASSSSLDFTTKRLPTYTQKVLSQMQLFFFFFNENALQFILHENLQLCAPWDPDSVGKEHGVYSLSLNPQT